MNMLHRLVALLGLAVIFSACTTTPTPTANITTDIPSTPTGYLQVTSTPSPTNTSTSSPSPTATTSQSPTPTSEPEEPELQIAYIDEDVYLWTESDGANQLTQTGSIYDLRLSPDGQHLAYSRLIDFERVELRLVAVDGGVDRLLVSVQDLEELVPHDEPVGIFSFEWLPNGDYLAFNTHIIGYGLLKNDDLHLVNIETGLIATLLPPGQGGDFYYSPDGNHIALVTSGDYMDLPGKINLVNADGSDPHDALVTFPSVLTYSEVPFYPPPTWSPDSTFFLVAIPSLDPLAPDASITVWRIPVDGSPAKNLFTINTSFFLSGLPFFSPDLSQVAYLQQIGDPDEPWFNLHIIRVETSQDIVYHEGPLDYFSWIPETDTFAFVSGDPVLILGRLGEDPQLTDLPWGNFLVWVDSESYLTVERSQDDQESLVYLNTFDGERQLLFPLISRFPSTFDIRK
jgi:Tol biopolymer transport system component